MSLTVPADSYLTYTSLRFAELALGSERGVKDDRSLIGMFRHFRGSTISGRRAFVEENFDFFDFARPKLRVEADAISDGFARLGTKHRNRRIVRRCTPAGTEPGCSRGGFSSASTRRSNRRFSFLHLPSQVKLLNVFLPTFGHLTSQNQIITDNAIGGCCNKWIVFVHNQTGGMCNLTPHFLLVLGYSKSFVHYPVP